MSKTQNIFYLYLKQRCKFIFLGNLVEVIGPISTFQFDFKDWNCWQKDPYSLYKKET